jgi:arabinofuranosyltransferase
MDEIRETRKGISIFREKAFLAILVCFILWCIVFIYRSSFIAPDGRRYFSLFDDAMISMRYAWNFSHGQGLVWNSGQYVEGYTNLLMTLVMSVSAFVFNKSIAVLSIQIIGIGLIIAIAVISTDIADGIISTGDIRHRFFIKVLVFCGTLSYYPLVYWTLMGMETGLLTLFLFLSIRSGYRYIHQRDPAKLYHASLFLGLAFLTRPDSAIYAVIIFFYVILETATLKKWIPRGMVYALALYLLFVAGQTVFRWLYYGELLPNTYTLKLSGTPVDVRLSDGLIFIKKFLVETALFVFFAILDLIINFRMKKLFLFTLVLAAIGYQIIIGGDVWIYWRMLASIVPLLIILFLNSLSHLYGLAARPAAGEYTSHPGGVFPKHHRYEYLIVFVFIFCLGSSTARFLPEIFFVEKPYTVGYNEKHVSIAVILNEVLTDNASIGVFNAGCIPYYTGMKSIDFLGKSDSYISHLAPDISGSLEMNGMKSIPGHNKYDLEYSIKKLRPTYAQGYRWGRQDISSWADSLYTTLGYGKIQIHLLRNSRDVRWDTVDSFLPRY